MYGQIHALRQQGRVPTGIVLPHNLYQVIQEYRSGLGEVPGGLPDYLGRYDLFGLPIYTDGGETIVIKARRASS